MSACKLVGGIVDDVLVFRIDMAGMGFPWAMTGFSCNNHSRKPLPHQVWFLDNEILNLADESAFFEECNSEFMLMAFNFHTNLQDVELF